MGFTKPKIKSIFEEPGAISESLDPQKLRFQKWWAIRLIKQLLKEETKQFIYAKVQLRWIEA